MEITFVRHGQTEWNSMGKQQGKEDIPLNSQPTISRLSLRMTPKGPVECPHGLHTIIRE